MSQQDQGRGATPPPRPPRGPPVPPRDTESPGGTRRTVRTADPQRGNAPTRAQLAQRTPASAPGTSTAASAAQNDNNPRGSVPGTSTEAREKPRRTFFKRGETQSTERQSTVRSGHRESIAAGHGNLKVKTSRILYTTDEEVRDALMEFGVFIIFLILTSLVTLSVRHSYMFYFNDTMKKLFTNRDMMVAPSVTINFGKLITVPDWWDYLVYGFFVTLHGDMHHMPLNDTQTETETTDDSETTEEPPPEEEDVDDGDGDDDDDRSSDESTRKKRKVWDNDHIEYDGDLNYMEKARKTRQAVPPDRAGFARKGSSGGGGGAGSSVGGKYGSFNGSGTPHLHGRVFLHENLLLGPPRLRQIRVRRESCYVNDAFIRYFNTCYAAYSAGAEENTGYHKGTKFRTMSELDSTPLWTVLGSYHTGGYTVDFTYDRDANQAIIQDLKEKHWLDRGSRLCLIEFNLYNENTDIFQSAKLIAEIPPTGGVIPQTHLQTVKQYSFFTDRSLLMTVIYIFWYIMVVYYTIYEIVEIRKTGVRNYFRSLLNLLDSIILLFCYCALVYNVWHSFKVIAITDRVKNEDGYQSLDGLCYWNTIYVDMMAILAFLVWIKIFKFISFNKTLVQFTTTLKRCSKDLAGFSLMFGIVFLAYAQLGLLLFGTKHPDFRNFITSILTMIRMILGDFQYNLIEEANRVLGPIYFLTYILLVFFILLNMFLAIIMETYNSVKSEITQGRSQLGSYVYKKLAGAIYFITHCGRKRRPPQQREMDPAAGDDDNDDSAHQYDQPKELRRNMTPAEARYFEEIPDDVQNKEMVRLNNRVALLEEILEQLVTNMDAILKRVEREANRRR
ncbi:polycystin-2-like protein 2 [Drosophila tropicalis]|uniref:polycystin-2-like protein 2 n=1 Tax=Drosophila tropicalis TaxID=46794 RepID=UPI0035AB744F